MSGITNPSRADTYSVGLNIDNVDYGIFDKMSGGEVDSEETKYKPGGMAPELSLGGSRSVGNVTISRIYDLDRDHSVAKTLAEKAGRGDAIVTKQPLDVNGVPYGDALVYKGKLKAVTYPEVDSTSSDPGMLELEISSAAIVG